MSCLYVAPDVSTTNTLITDNGEPISYGIFTRYGYNDSFCAACTDLLVVSDLFGYLSLTWFPYVLESQPCFLSVANCAAVVLRRQAMQSSTRSASGQRASQITNISCSSLYAFSPFFKVGGHGDCVRDFQQEHVATRSPGEWRGP